MLSYSQKYYEKNKAEIILKNTERQSKSEKYKAYQKEYYIKNKKKSKTDLSENDKWLKEYNKKLKKSEYYKEYYDNKKVKNKIEKTITLIL
jgi:hypothetical protein